MILNKDTLKTWCSINLDAAAYNYNHTKSKTGSEVICVIKANGYGHGALPLAQRLEKEGCVFFAVSCIEEALELRSGGIKSGILVLGYILPCNIKTAVENGISFACASLDFAKEIAKADFEGKAKVHIKLNTGMNRTGFCICHSAGYKDLKSACEILLNNSDKIETEGIFSHFAKAESDAAFTKKQWGYFENAADFIKNLGINARILHICNSEGTFRHPEMHLDAVRLGIHLYGCECDETFKPVMEFCTRIVDIHTLKEGDGVSYGLDFVADKEMKIAVIGAGYGDGLLRCLSHGKGSVLIGGKKCPIIGRICMDMSMVDISSVSDAKIGDKVIIWGKGLSCDEQAKNAGTISYELLCGVAPRVLRIYE